MDTMIERLNALALAADTAVRLGFVGDQPDVEKQVLEDAEALRLAVAALWQQETAF